MGQKCIVLSQKRFETRTIHTMKYIIVAVQEFTQGQIKKRKIKKLSHVQEVKLKTSFTIKYVLRLIVSYDN